VIIARNRGIAGARSATGPTVVIDVFRAFSAAAFALAAGAERIVLAETVEEAVSLAADIPRAVLMGEVRGVKPPEFDLGNSPGEIRDDPALVSGRTVVHRSSSGTRCARAAFAAGARPLYVAGLVVASATARVLDGAGRVTIVASGIGGNEAAAEDDICGDLIAELLLTGNADVATYAARVAGLDRAQTLQRASFTHPDDIALCTDSDRFDFAMPATAVSGRMVVSRV
jgi:2-phosphosulfolactate phosphatase